MCVPIYCISVLFVVYLCCFFFFKQMTAYEMRISDWSSDVCSSDLGTAAACARPGKFNTPYIDRLQRRGCEGVPPGAGRILGRWSRQIGRVSCRERVCQYG